METEYQVKYPLWIEGQGQYTENHQKQKLLAYASKCHTPIFGEGAASPASNSTPGRKCKSLDRVTTRSKLGDRPTTQNKKTSSVSRSHSRVRSQARSVAPKKGVGKPVITRQIRCVPGVRRKTKINLSFSTSAYLKLLCNIDNVRPAPTGIR